jgi:hypothetical protein
VEGSGAADGVQSVNGPVVVLKSSRRDGELYNLRPRAEDPNEQARATATGTDTDTSSRRVRKFSDVRAWVHACVRAEKAPNHQLQQPSVPSRRLVVRPQANGSGGRGLDKCPGSFCRG